jgi:hypothetical protein
MHYEAGRNRSSAQKALTQTRQVPKIRAAYLDRLRERPLEAGATTEDLNRPAERCQLLRNRADARIR